MGSFYWLKLKKDFFKRHDMIILRSMENGLTYEAIFIHLMAESIDHEAKLRYSDRKPYTALTLSAICDVSQEIMKEALKAFEDLELIEILEDGTIFIPLASENIGSATDNANANRQRRYRERQAEQARNNEDDTDNVTECNDKRYGSVTKRNESIEYRDKSLEIRDKKREKDERDKSLSSKKREIPTKDEVIRFAHAQKIDKIIDADQFWNFYTDQEWKIQGEDIKDWKSLLMKWANNVKDRKNVVEIPYMENDYDFSQYDDPNNEKALKELDEFIEKGKIEKNEAKIIGADGKEKTALWNSL